MRSVSVATLQNVARFAVKPAIRPSALHMRSITSSLARPAAFTVPSLARMASPSISVPASMAIRSMSSVSFLRDSQVFARMKIPYLNLRSTRRMTITMITTATTTTAYLARSTLGVLLVSSFRYGTLGHPAGILTYSLPLLSTVGILLFVIVGGVAVSVIALVNGMWSTWGLGKK